ncbi:MAG: TetR/AcrR family transcriptional regulator [Duganella sp.]
MTTSPTKRRIDPEKALGRRNQVLEAAAVCFARSGFHGASMSEISKQAGMSAGHIYNYFDSKDAIIFAFVDREAEYVTDLLSDLESRDDPLEALLDEAGKAIDDNLVPQPWHVPLEMYAEASRNPVVAAKLRENSLRSRDHMRGLVRRGRELRKLPVDDVLLNSRVDAMICFFHGLPVRAMLHEDIDRDGMVEAYRTVMRALLLT